MTDLAFWLFAAATFFLAGIVKGVTGMGLPTVAMALLGAVVPPAAAASLLVVPSFVTNLWQLFSGPDVARLIRRLWPMMLCLVVATVLGSPILAKGNAAWTAAALGFALIAYSAHALFARPVAIAARTETWLSPVVGLATGAVTGATGVLVMPAVPFLQSLGLARDDLVQALGLSFTVSTVALAAGLASNGAFRVESLVLSCLAIAPALAGMWMGQAIRGRVSPERFRRWFLICLMALGMELASRPFL